MGYIPLSAIERVYKRLAISQSYFKGNLFGTLCYLVVRYDGKEKAFRFTHEENLDAILEQDTASGIKSVFADTANIGIFSGLTKIR